VLNPARKHYASLKERLITRYEDIYFDEDAIFMERNSRTFTQRAAKIDANAEQICDLLHASIQHKKRLLLTHHPSLLPKMADRRTLRRVPPYAQQRLRRAVLARIRELPRVAGVL
jgi:cystathionine beta-lyase/cystathionine gamma-synthase